MGESLEKVMFEKLDASYTLSIDDVLIEAKHRGRFIKAEHFEGIMVWLQNKMPDFFSFAKDELLNAVINEFTNKEV